MIPNLRSRRARRQIASDALGIAEWLRRQPDPVHAACVGIAAMAFMAALAAVTLRHVAAI